MLDDTIEELRTIALDAGDASGYFPAMYARVTARIRDAAAEGAFDDPQGMVRFARAFAGWYLRPRAGTEEPPRCWAAAWDVADDRGLLIVQHLLLGINAHVNHDLPLVVVELADGGPVEPLRPDFDTVNDVLSDTMPAVIRDLGRVSRWVNLAAGMRGGGLFDFSLRAARTQAWNAAVRLNELDADARAADVAELDRLVAGLAHMIARPGRPVRWLLPVARLLEDRDPDRVARRLLGPLS